MFALFEHHAAASTATTKKQLFNKVSLLSNVTKETRLSLLSPLSDIANKLTSAKGMQFQFAKHMPEH